jgi:hypothetical protein
MTTRRKHVKPFRIEVLSVSLSLCPDRASVDQNQNRQEISTEAGRDFAVTRLLRVFDTYRLDESFGGMAQEHAEEMPVSELNISKLHTYIFCSIQTKLGVTDFR